MRCRSFWMHDDRVHLLRYQVDGILIAREPVVRSSGGNCGRGSFSDVLCRNNSFRQHGRRSWNFCNNAMHFRLHLRRRRWVSKSGSGYQVIAFGFGFPVPSDPGISLDNDFSRNGPWKFSGRHAHRIVRSHRRFQGFRHDGISLRPPQLSDDPRELIEVQHSR